MAQDVKFTIYGYNDASARVLKKIFDHFTQLDPLLRQLGNVTTYHDGPIRNIRGEDPVDQELFEIQSIGHLHMDDIRETNIENVTEFIMEMVFQVIDHMHKSFFININTIVEATGQTVDAKGKRFSFDLVLDMLEGMAVDFDEHGSPILPTLIMHPDQYKKVSSIEITEAQKKRQAEILATKKAEFDAQKRTRRLSFRSF